MSKNYKTKISLPLLDEIRDALESVNYGSIEIYVQNKVVTQITVRNIHKTSVEIEPDQEDFQITDTADIKKGTNIQNKIYISKDTAKVR